MLRKAGLVEQVATLLALLATEAPRDVVKFRGKTIFVATGPRALPQGAPSSPMITNAVCLRLDRRLSGLSRKLNCSYTRYADDLTFSFRDKAPIGMLVGSVTRILREEGFTVNEKKTVVMKKGMRQKVTGLVVNPAPGKPAARVPRETRRKLRAAIHNWKKGKKDKDTLQQMAGMAAFIHMTDPVLGKKLLDEIQTLT
jgi:retron-type reverse transcriptase